MPRCPCASFELVRAQVPKPRVFTAAVVEPVDVLTHRTIHLRDAFVTTMMHPFLLQRRKERFCHRVVIAVAHRSHRQTNVVASAERLELQRRIRRALVRMVDHPRPAAVAQRVRKRPGVSVKIICPTFDKKKCPASGTFCEASRGRRLRRAADGLANLSGEQRRGSGGSTCTTGGIGWR